MDHNFTISNISGIPQHVGAIPPKVVSDPSTAYRAILLFIGVPLATTTILGNFLVILAWITDRRVRTPSNAYLASLAVVDMLIGLICMTMGLKYNYDGVWLMGYGACQFWLTSVYSSVFISSAHLTLVALDRHRIVFEGVSYIQNRPYTGVLQCVVATWLIGIWISSPILLDFENVIVDPKVKVHCLIKPTFLGTVYFSSLNIIFPALLMVGLYARIYFQLRQRWRKRAAKHVSAPETSTTSVSGADSGCRPKSHISSDVEENTPKTKVDNAALQQKERNAATTLGILIGIYIVCWTPYVITTFLRVYGVPVPRVLPVLCGIMGWVNSAVNPIVYAVRNLKFRDAFKRMFSFCWKF